MNAKGILTGVLLVFVIASFGYMLIQEQSESEPVETVQAEQTTENPDNSNHVLVYYFHGNVRCQTCQKIEAYGEEAVQTAFAEALSSGEIQWKVVNVEESGNSHFIDDFELTNKTIVVAKPGETPKWKKLDRVWELVGDKSAFLAYIQDEVRTFAGENS